ncbi:PREDICTED: RING-H2 finger protein ATL52-like [Ipomoea nil]|uniref:RING-H2 finger protein ATL52-like n=1 Tax=Ipomoea nil TaxID=35883 RepID=UPI000900F5E4|nr:PREDICTED: RING-H2 finger protein ATL52-like [Ipomoea nil]
MAASPTNSTSHPPPPTPSPSHPKSNLPMLYYGLVVIGTAAIVLALYNLLIIRWCAESRRRTRLRNLRMGDSTSFVSFRSSDSRSINLNLAVSSFRYKNEGVEVNECAVCLSAFEDGEEVRRLPKCNHSFHAPCIDMWLYSHMDCPLCRSPVEPPVLTRHKNTATEQALEGNTSQEGLIVPNNASSIV